MLTLIVTLNLEQLTPVSRGHLRFITNEVTKFEVTEAKCASVIYHKL